MLDIFLKTKPLYYDKIDYTRMPRVYSSIKAQIKLPNIIHIIGTNGKGTTGRFLAVALHSLGFSTGHYTSPHLMKFNERIWLNGEDISDAHLNKAHEKLLKLLKKEDAQSLSYFEYTTLLALFIYQNFDYVVLEAGLGGEHDATSVFDNILTLVMPIDFDHEAFLGNTIKEITLTKIKAVQKHAIFADQKHEEVFDLANKLFNASQITLKKQNDYIQSDDKEKIKLISLENKLENYLEENLSVSIAALKYLSLSYKVANFTKSKLFGRLSQLNEYILLDVGHNTLAAQRIYESLKFFKYTLVYNSFKDKDYKKILQILQPIITDVEIIKINDIRVESHVIMQETLFDLGIQYKDFSNIQKGKKYLVFGSFSVAEAFLKVYFE